MFFRLPDIARKQAAIWQLNVVSQMSAVSSQRAQTCIASRLALRLRRDERRIIAPKDCAVVEAKRAGNAPALCHMR
jgi:hypothetical protein